MSHAADGYEMEFTYRGSWKANLAQRGLVLEVVPVTWTKGRRIDSATREIFQEVWIKDRAELEARAADPTPFVVALGEAHDYSQMPHAFKSLKGFFRVSATGKLLSDISLETRVLERLRAE